MRYKNAEKILPGKLLREVQKYARGSVVYVPDKKRAAWGEINGTRERYACRNKEIIELYDKGFTREEIAEKYFLSVCSIKKIVLKRDKI